MSRRASGLERQPVTIHQSFQTRRGKLERQKQEDEAAGEIGSRERHPFRDNAPKSAQAPCLLLPRVAKVNLGLKPADRARQATAQEAGCLKNAAAQQVG